MPDDLQFDAHTFRAPTRREHRIAAALFIGFGLFFAALFVVLSGWWFRWVILVLAGYSILDGVGHLRSASNVLDRHENKDADDQRNADQLHN